MAALFARGYAQPPPILPAGRGVHIYRTAIVMPIITFIFVALRYYSRRYVLKKSITIEDYVVAATMVSNIIHAVLMVLATRNGMGLHIWQLPPDSELSQRYYLWIGISSMFYVTSLAGFKAALLFLFLGLFGRASDRFRLACYLTLFYSLGYLWSNLLTEFLGCDPIAKKWDPTLPGKCINHVAEKIAYGFGNISSDLIIAALPLPMIWRLQFPSTRAKIGISLVLTNGFIAFAIACVRAGIVAYNMLAYDRPWWAGISFVFSILEVNTGLICTCTPALSPLFSLLWTSLKRHVSGGSDLDSRALVKERTNSNALRPAAELDCTENVDTIASYRNSENSANNPNLSTMTSSDDRTIGGVASITEPDNEKMDQANNETAASTSTV